MKFLSLTVLAFFIAMGVQAQKSSLGVKVGITSFDIRGDGDANSDKDPRMAGSFGLTYTYSSSENFGIGVELNYMGKGYTTNETSNWFFKTVEMDYLEIPILANLYFGSSNFRPKVFLGLLLGFC